MPSRTRILVALLLLTACGGKSVSGPQVVTVTISPSTKTLTSIGATVQLSATGTTDSGSPASGVTFSWTSSSSGVATVDANGLVTAVANGSATITATADGGVAATAQVDVAQVAAAVTVTPALDTLTAGATVQLAAAATDAGGTAVANPAVTWASSDADLATVDAGGDVKALRSGSVQITATVDQATGSASLEVVRPEMHLQSDTVLSGVVAVDTLTVPAGVTVTASSDLQLDVLGDASLAGAVQAPCDRLDLMVRGNLSLTGSLTNTCATTPPDSAGPGITITVLGTDTIDGATIQSNGQVFVRGDSTTTASAAAAAVASSAAVPSRAARAGDPYHHDIFLRNATIQLTPDEMPAGADGEHAGGDGVDAPPVILDASGDLTLDNTVVKTPRGGRGGKATAEGTEQTVEARGGHGGSGGNIVLSGTDGVGLAGADGASVLDAGTGGRGGDAVAIADQNGDLSVAPGATATGGDAGRSGTITLPDGLADASVLRIVVHDGQDGGNAEARGATGVDASSGRAAQPGGSASAEGGEGEPSTSFAGATPAGFVDPDRSDGVGGAAVAVGGNGGNGSEASPDGAAGGSAQAVIGIEATGFGLGSFDRPRNAISASGGNGGDGADECQPSSTTSFTGTIRVLSDPGSSDPYIFEAGAGGIPLSLNTTEVGGSTGGNGGDGGSLEGVTLTDDVSSTLGPGGNGGSGGNGIPAGAGGKGGAIHPPAYGSVTLVTDHGKDGNGGVICPASAPSAAAVRVSVGPQRADGSSAITISGAAPWVDVTGTVAADGTVTASGRGTVAGFADILNTFAGTLDATAGTLVGDYSMDTEKTIDPNHPVVYRVEVTKN